MMRDGTQVTDAKTLATAGRARSRLVLEIAVVLVVKFLLLYVIWAVWFAHPASRNLDERGVAATLLGVNHGPVERRETRE